jgi:hypothetical protein
MTNDHEVACQVGGGLEDVEERFGLTGSTEERYRQLLEILSAKGPPPEDEELTAATPAPAPVDNGAATLPPPQAPFQRDLARDALPGLRDAAEHGRPFPPEAEQLFGQLRAAHLADLFRGLQLRTRLPGLTRDDQPYTLDVALLAQLRGELRPPPRPRPGDGEAAWQCYQEQANKPRPPSPAALARELFCRFAVLTSPLSPVTARKALHVYQVQCQPGIVRTRMRRYYALTYLPSRQSSDLPADGLIDLGSLKALTLTVRRHAVRGGKAIDMFDIRLHKFDVDPESGVVYAGGTSTGRDGQVSSRCGYSRYFNYAPYRTGKHSKIVDQASVNIIEGGIALHREMEQVALCGGTVQAHPQFPRVYLAFTAEDAMTFEVTPALEQAAYLSVYRWLTRKKPPGWLNLDEGTNACPTVLARLRDRLHDLPQGWGDVARVVGPEDAEFLLLRVWDYEQVEHQGLALIPLEFFARYSEQRPVQRARRIFARFGKGLLGRRAAAVEAQSYSDGAHEISRPVGKLVTLPEVAAAQVIHQPRPGDPPGPDGFVYDWSATPVGWERFFEPARG